MKNIIKFFFILFFLINSTISAKDSLDLIDQCNKEASKDIINIPLLKNICSQVAKIEEKNKNYNDASFYYLLAGKPEYVSSNMVEHTDSNTSSVLYANLAHSYVLTNNNNKYFLKKMYKKFLYTTELPSSNIAIKNDYSIFEKLYPNKKEYLKYGLKLWNEIYRPYKTIEKLYKRYNKEQKDKNYKKSIEYLSEIHFLLENLNSKNITGEIQPHLAFNYQEMGLVYQSRGYYRKALSQYKKSLSIRKKIFGKLHLDMSLTYNYIAIVYSEMGNYYKALEYEKKSIVIDEKLLDKNHPDIATSYDNIGGTYADLDDYLNAEKYQRKALAIRIKIFGKKDTETATSYNNIGETYSKIGNYSEALKYLYKALAIWIKTEEYSSTATVYDNIGQVQGKKGNQSEAISSAEKALKIREELWGDNHPTIALSYSNISAIHTNLADYKKALRYERKALAIRVDILGQQHVDTALSYTNIGLIYSVLGNYPKALEYTKKALAIQKEILNKEHSYIALSYHNIGRIYADVGDYSRALEYEQDSLLIKEKIFGQNHPDIATLHNHIGVLYSEIGDYDNGMIHQEKGLEIRLKILGNLHSSVSASYNSISVTYQNKGDYPNALEYQKKSLEVSKKTLGEEHPDTATGYANMGFIYAEMNNYPEALSYQRKALAIRKRLLDKQHPSLANSYQNMSLIYGKMNDYSMAYQYTRKSFAIFIQQRYRNFSILDSKQKQQYLKVNESDIGFLLFNAFNYYHYLLKNNKNKQAKNLKQVTINDWISYKGSILDNENNLIKLVKNSKNIRVKSKHQQLVKAKQLYSRLYQENPGFKNKQKLKIWKQQIEKKKSKIISLEYEIIQTDPLFEKGKKLNNIKSKDVSRGLLKNKNELYVDYAKTNAGYYIFTIDYKNTISFDYLGKKSSKDINDQLASFRKEINGIKKIMISMNNKNKKLLHKNKIKLNYKLKKHPKEILAKLYELIIKKSLSSKLLYKTSLIISPDGALSLLPFEALYDQTKSQYLIEKKNIRYIASGKELVRLYRQQEQEDNQPEKQSTVLFANPDFDKDPKAKVSEIPQIFTPNTNESSSIYSLRSGSKFSALSGTKKEAEGIITILEKVKQPYALYVKDSASELNLMKIKQPNILHIATHGFFNAKSPNPMLQSGIALAGANYSLEHDQGEGIVTALDLSGMELKGTDLVVLSACETGKVDPNSTEGISGLTKAFIQAGAKNVIMSLWAVSDNKTADLMQAFYRENKTNGKQYATALKDSKLEMIKKGLHPYYWAAFVLSGL